MHKDQADTARRSESKFVGKGVSTLPHVLITRQLGVLQTRVRFFFCS